jgi:DNA (cytosine-5)-methyltransferase 1
VIEWTDFFAGAGGSSEGLRRAGHRVRYAANHWDLAVATHEKNHPDTEHDLAELSTETNYRLIPRTSALWASPSCTKHSAASHSKQGSVEDELRRDTAEKIDRATAFAVLSATEVHRYDVVVVENVQRFLKWVLFPAWLQGMRLLGLREQIVVLDAADVGPVPCAQDRKRVFIVFTRDGSVNLTPPPVQRTPAAAILDPAEGLGEPLERRLYVSPQIDTIRERNVPYLVTYRRNAKARRADRSQLQTLCAGGRHHAIATLTDDGPLHRFLTRRELARAQGFPDSYEFLGGDEDVRRQIGNAVAVPVATFLAERIAAHLENPDLPPVLTPFGDQYTLDSLLEAK